MAKSVRWLLLMGLMVGCVPKHKPATSIGSIKPVPGPSVRILGIAQDGGLPHAACDCPRCDAAQRDPKRASYVASLGIIAPKEDKTYVIDTTPDIIPQLALLSDVRAGLNRGVDRSPLDGVFLTHAHIGHYIGLAHFGFEAINTKGLSVWCSRKMGAFLQNNAPWDQLVKQKNIELNTAQSQQPIKIADGITVTPIVIPHRAEYTDTLGYYIKGANKTVLYIPDTAPWRAWDQPLEQALQGVDIALLDGTFYSGDELPGRDISKIGHPLIVDTMDRLQSRVEAGTLEVHFIHLNHSNPALNPNSTAYKTLIKRGFKVGYAGQNFRL